MTSNNINLTPEQRTRINSTWRQFLRTGNTPSEIRDLVTTDSHGTSVIPQGFDPNFTEALKFYGPIATLVKRRDSETGAPQKFAITDSVGYRVRLHSRQTPRNLIFSRIRPTVNPCAVPRKPCSFGCGAMPQGKGSSSTCESVLRHLRRVCASAYKVLWP